MVCLTLCRNSNIRNLCSRKKFFAVHNTYLRFTLFCLDETLSHKNLVGNLTMRGSALGTVLYSCTATNRAGTSEQKTCQVTVIRKGEIILASDQLLSQDLIKYMKHFVIVIKGYGRHC